MIRNNCTLNYFFSQYIYQLIMQINHNFPKRGIKIINRSKQSLLSMKKEEPLPQQHQVLAQSVNFNNYSQQKVSASQHTTARSIVSNPYLFISQGSKNIQKYTSIQDEYEPVTSLRVIDFTTSSCHLTTQSPFNSKVLEKNNQVFLPQSSPEIIRLASTKIPAFQSNQSNKPSVQRHNKAQNSQFSYFLQKSTKYANQQQKQQKLTQSTFIKNQNVIFDRQSQRNINQNTIDLSFSKHNKIQQTMGFFDKQIPEFSQQNYLKSKYLDTQNKLKEQNSKLLKQLDLKNQKIEDLTAEIAYMQKKYHQKISSLQKQLRQSQSKHRPQANSYDRHRLSMSAHVRTEKATEQMFKRKFFQTDLIQARDYFQLSQELKNAQSINDKMVDEHQAFIVQVSQHRKLLNDQIQILQLSHQQFTKDNQILRARIQEIERRGDDKMVIIKLQNEINFLRSKMGDQMQIIMEKERQLENATLQIKRITEQNNNSSNNYHKDSANLEQINRAISEYEERIIRLNLVIIEKDSAIDSQKKLVSQLQEKLSQSKEDMKINIKKEQSYQNSLKNQIQTLQRTLKNEQQISSKKMSTLQQILARKTKQIMEKDNFIKQFLISRAKKLDNISLEQIQNNIKEFFQSKVHNN